MIPDIPYIIKSPSKDNLLEQSFHTQRELVTSQIEIEWHHKRYDFIKNTFEFSGGVKIYYQDFIIISESAWINLENKTGGTHEKSKIVHPRGSMEVESFYWNHKKSEAKKVSFFICGIKGRCDTSLFKEKKITFQNLNLNFEPAGLMKISSPYCEIQNENVFFKKPHFNILGLGFQMDQKKFNSKENYVNLALPQIKIRGSKYGFSWSPYYEINKRALLDGNIQSSAWQSLSLSGSVNIKLIDKSPFTGGSDLDEPFSTSYLDNVRIEEKNHEIGNLATPRWNIRVMTGQNLEASGRIENKKNIFTISKPYDIQMDLGGIKNLPINFQFQVQSVKKFKTTPLVKRNLISFQAVPLVSQINENVALSLRTDGRYSQGGLKKWGWIRGIVGIQVSSDKKIDNKWGLDLGFSRGKLFGQTDFEFDEPFSLNDFHFRLFYRGKKYSIDYLTRYSYDRGKWYDHQVKMGCVCGAFEPYILYNSSSGAFNLGIDLTILKLFN